MLKHIILAMVVSSTGAVALADSSGFGLQASIAQDNQKECPFANHAGNRHDHRGELSNLFKTIEANMWGSLLHLGGKGIQ